MNAPADDDDVPDLVIADEPQPQPQSDPYERRKVPITLLTGYLGAGKSTLLEYILTANHGYKIAVCMNDFGDTTDIEAKSLTLSDPTTQTQTSSFLSLPNGCLCCSFKDMGIAAIEEMVASQPGGVDWVLVELTGVADPVPIAKSFWANEEMGDLILDGIICVVDSRNIEKQLGESRMNGEMDEAQKQIGASDIILLNKIDLINPDQLTHVESLVKSINPTLRVYRTTKSQIDLRELFDLRAYSSPSFPTDRQVQDTHEHDHDHDHGHDHRHDEPPSHHHGITTLLISLPPLTPEQYQSLTNFLEILLWKGVLPVPTSSNSDPTVQPPQSTPPKSQSRITPSTQLDQSDGPNRLDSTDQLEILRCKGYIPLTNGTSYVLQGVTDLFELNELPSTTQQSGQNVQGTRGKVVFIGRGVGERIKESLLAHINVKA